MNTVSRFDTISNLRDRAYLQANLRIDQLNQLDDFIFKNSPAAPKKRDRVSVDKTNISLSYAQNGIDISNLLMQEISEKYAYVKYLYEKNQECMDLYHRFLEPGEIA